ncbi:MAG TPA: ABC transporter substrate-binding protein [Aliidongia sp.]|uniref:ABC transporter substrate-binding protein n=1 Tax=Aliidongia sp. TaxID=1914230 RepID=UPI002DDD1A4E|nr:ABC transporter substrate-binding protein [Aliidongia sp.]HEV2677631.1 ABC transporter substrate-binding protein [Aliidongia sp.]
MTRTLTAALGRYRHTAALRDGEVSSPSIAFEFAEITPISRAFAPMVRQQRFDVAEMAIATALQALAYGKPITVLPVAVAARFQEGALLCRTDSDMRDPADLVGRRIGVRAYGQTTAMWLRGILADGDGLDPAASRWTTFEEAHVAEYGDPPWAERAPPGANLLDMLRDGTLDAAIVGNDVPDDPAFRTLFADPTAAAARFRATHGFMPVNHLVVVRRSLAEEDPALIAELVRLFERSRDAADPGGSPAPPIGYAAVAPSWTLAARYCMAQGLLPETVSAEALWPGPPTA